MKIVTDKNSTHFRHNKNTIINASANFGAIPISELLVSIAHRRILEDISKKKADKKTKSK